MDLRVIEAVLPHGFQVRPRDEELLVHYLQGKANGHAYSSWTPPEVDLREYDPWELPDMAKLGDEWYFFCFRKMKYARGTRINRASKSGNWKSTGKDRAIYKQATHAMVGMKKTLVFYMGRAPNRIKTDWFMDEFRLENHHIPPGVADDPRGDWVLCRVFCKRKGESSRNLDTSGSPIPPSLVNDTTGGYEPQPASNTYSQAPEYNHEDTVPLDDNANLDSLWSDLSPLQNFDDTMDWYI